MARARAHLAAGEPELARAVLEQPPADPTADPGFNLLLGRALLAGPDVRRGERLLREELATGPRSADAALWLCDHLTAEERFEDARAVVAAASAREPQRVDLALLEARLLQDCWELDAAAARLRELLAVHPQLAAARVQLADVEHCRGDVAAAASSLAEARPDDPWVAAHADQVAALRRDIEAEPRNWTVRDLLAMLRGAPDLGLRLRAFDALIEVPTVRDAAIRVAAAQRPTALRVRAIRAIPAEDPMLPSDLEAAMGDPDPRVRGTALRRCAEIPDLDTAVRLALDGLMAEEDPYAFRAAHDALTARLGPLVALPPDGEGDPDVRRQTRESWRQLCPE